MMLKLFNNMYKFIRMPGILTQANVKITKPSLTVKKLNTQKMVLYSLVFTPR